MSDDEKKVAFLAGQHDANIRNLFSDVAEIKQAVCRLEKMYEARIRRLEYWRTFLVGGWSALVATWAYLHGASK